MKKIGIIDADLIGRKKHRFPNLACEKISGYWKNKGAEVHLILSFEDIEENKPITLFDDNSCAYDRIYISKVFTDTPVPQWVEKLRELPADDKRKIQIGGTGFYFDKAPPLDYEIEHCMPDYHLYDDWINDEVKKAECDAQIKGTAFEKSRFMVQFKEYTDYSIGFLTRGCFRKCKFCVNQKYNHVFLHSPLKEFFDENRKKICLLDDNVLGCNQWRELFDELRKTGKPFKFKQGMDERILSPEKCNILFSSNYDGDYTFAFDNIGDYEIIQKKLELIRKTASPKASIKFYVLVGFESTDEMDIANAFKRIELLMKYRCLPYVMRYQNMNDTPWKKSEYRDMYIAIARWANQPSLFKKMSFRQFCIRNQSFAKSGELCSTLRAMLDFETKHKEIAEMYFDLRFDEC